MFSISLPAESNSRTGLPLGSSLERIGTPLVFSGFEPAAISAIPNQLQAMAFVAAQGRHAARARRIAHLVPATWLYGSGPGAKPPSIPRATVTAVQADRSLSVATRL